MAGRRGHRDRPGAGAVAEKATPAAYVAWSLWLMATGVALLT
jgi:hypothetical protein